MELTTKNRATLPKFSIKTTMKTAQNRIIDSQSLVQNKRQFGTKNTVDFAPIVRGLVKGDYAVTLPLL